MKTFGWGNVSMKLHSIKKNMGSAASRQSTREGERWADNVSAGTTFKSDSEVKTSQLNKKSSKVGPLVSPNDDELSTKSDGEERKSRRSTDSEKRPEKEPTERVQLTEGVVQDYINLEKAINKLERKNVMKKYESQTIYADNLKNTVEQLEAVLKELRKQTQVEVKLMKTRGYRDRTFQGEWDARFEKEKNEYEDAVNKQEAVEKELELSKVKFETAQRVTEIYKQQTDELLALYEKQDKMLSCEETSNLRDFQVDEMMDWQQRVALAMFKWANGRVLLVHALTQITFGINRWQDIKKIEASNSRARYFAAAEARNNFIAAAQNVQSCRMYLNKVEFPYATEEEIILMEDTATSAFKNVQDDKVVKKALKVFQETQGKVARLIQWFDKVINDTIRKDLDQANNAVIKKQKALREERLSLMKKQTQKELGHSLEFEYDSVSDDDLEKELKALEEQAIKEMKSVKDKKISEILSYGPSDSNTLPLSKLAPIPSKDALFGRSDVKQKLTEHDSSRKEFVKRNYIQREKQAMAIQEKLKMRRQKNRRTRKQRRESVAPV
ncbi:unnamed protein product [Nippostrongylus brasiliensis]|uniref:PH domain-containing protein n=1 Tax=Nippostrongylus brasiliensis TaxID=27835 RepID=A0A0N4YBB3_NIPBR|nr:unnamed protein product [Nippostrongylus brasiliensis]